MTELQISKKCFNKIYIPYLTNETKTQIFFGGSSSGKSYFLAQRTILDIVSGGHNYLIVRNVALTVRRSVFNEIIKAISFFKLEKRFSVNKSDLVITCNNGSQILFGGLDDPEKIKSITPAHGVITDIWIEEATECMYEAVKQLYKRLRGRSQVKKRIIMSFNPILKSHWIYQEYFGKWEEGVNSFQSFSLSILKTTYKDNQFLTAEDVEALENEKDRYFYEVYTLGNWGVVGKVIYKNWRVEDLTEKKKTIDRFCNGLDFGFSSDPSVGVHMHYDRRALTLYILDEFYLYNATNDILAAEIQKLAGNGLIICDSAEPKSIQELRNFGIHTTACTKGKDSLLFGIQWLQRQSIVIDKRCQHTINEIQQYKWKQDKDGHALPVPIDKNNHLLDAIRYGVEKEMYENQTAISWKHRKGAVL